MESEPEGNKAMCIGLAIYKERKKRIIFSTEQNKMPAFEHQCWEWKHTPKNTAEK